MTKGKATVVDMGETQTQPFTEYQVFTLDIKSSEAWEYWDSYYTLAEAEGAVEVADNHTCIIKIEIPAMTIGEKK